MKKQSHVLPVLVTVLILIFAAQAARAQDDQTQSAFVVFETTVTRDGVETSDKNPEEQRFYVSNVVDFPLDDPALFRRAPKIADEYFTANVVEPMKAKGILHQYYDDAIHINNSVVYRLDTKAEVEELRKKTLQDLKEQNANVFTFNWTRDENVNGLETSQPTLFHRGEEQPLYGAAESKTVEPKVVKSPAKKKN